MGTSYYSGYNYIGTPSLRRSKRSVCNRSRAVTATKRTEFSKDPWEARALAAAHTCKRSPTTKKPVACPSTQEHGLSSRLNLM